MKYFDHTIFEVMIASLTAEALRHQGSYDFYKSFSRYDKTVP